MAAFRTSFVITRCKNLNKIKTLRCFHNFIALRKQQDESAQGRIEYRRRLPEDKDDEAKTMLQILQPKKGISADTVAFLQSKIDLSSKAIKKWLQNREEKAEIHAQKFVPESHNLLGADLSAAHFIVRHNGSVRFQGQEVWVRKNRDGKYILPMRPTSGVYVEAIDISGTNLVYEGLSNLVGLENVKWLNMRNCKHVDDWCLDKLSHFRKTLEYLDISNCPLITERGLASLYRFKKLEVLYVEELANVQHKKLVHILLEDVLSKCKIIGLD